MSVVYGQLAAKQAAARIMAASGKRKHEYDSDEETEGGNKPLFAIHNFFGAKINGRKEIVQRLY